MSGAIPSRAPGGVRHAPSDTPDPDYIVEKKNYFGHERWRWSKAERLRVVGDWDLETIAIHVDIGRDELAKQFNKEGKSYFVRCSGCQGKTINSEINVHGTCDSCKAHLAKVGSHIYYNDRRTGFLQTDQEQYDSLRMPMAHQSEGRLSYWLSAPDA